MPKIEEAFTMITNYKMIYDIDYSHVKLTRTEVFMHLYSVYKEKDATPRQILNLLDSWLVKDFQTNEEFSIEKYEKTKEDD